VGTDLNVQVNFITARQFLITRKKYLRRFAGKRMKLYCDTTRAYSETKLVDPEYYSCNIPSIDGTTETSFEIILTEGYSFPKGRNAIQIIYRTGYKLEEMSESIKTATLELENTKKKCSIAFAGGTDSICGDMSVFIGIL